MIFQGLDTYDSGKSITLPILLSRCSKRVIHDIICIKFNE